MEKTNFFSQLHTLLGEDCTGFSIGIMESKEKLNVVITPKSDKDAFPPISFKGTAQEMDEGLLNSLHEAIQYARTSFSTIDEFKKLVDEKTKKETTAAVKGKDKGAVKEAKKEAADKDRIESKSLTDELEDMLKSKTLIDMSVEDFQKFGTKAKNAIALDDKNALAVKLNKQYEEAIPEREKKDQAERMEKSAETMTTKEPAGTERKYEPASHVEEKPAETQEPKQETEDQPQAKTEEEPAPPQTMKIDFDDEF